MNDQNADPAYHGDCERTNNNSIPEMGAKAMMIEHEGHSSIGRGDEESVDPAAPSGEDRPPIPVTSSLPHAAASFAASLARFAASGFKTVDEPLHELRMGHCGACEYLRGSQCSLCRCFIEKKAWLPHEDCPIGRWTS